MAESTSSLPAAKALAPGWREAGTALVLTLLWILWWHRETATAIVTIWIRSETFTHGFIVPPIAAWLIWRRRDVIQTMAPAPAKWCLWLFAAAAIAWLLGDLAAVQSVTQLALVSMIVLAVPIVLGTAITNAILFPLAFLFFAVPFGEFLMPQLMDRTADFTVWALRLSRVPVYREGLRFVIPTGSWSVVEACSGVRYLIASVTVGTLFAYLNYHSIKRRLVFVAVSFLVPIVANWMRAYMIVMLGHLSGNKLAVGVDHLIYGWLFFGVVILLMFMIGARWSEEPLVSVPSNQTITIKSQPASVGAVWTAAIAAALIATLPLLMEWNIKRSQVDGEPHLIAPTSLTPQWLLAEPSAIVWKPAFAGAAAEVNASYAGHGVPVGLYIGYYRNQDYSHKLVSSNNALVTSNDTNWAQVGSGSKALDLRGQQVRLRTAELRFVGSPSRALDSPMIVWHVYWINGTLTASDYLAKGYSALYRLLGMGDESAVIVISTPKGIDGAGVRALDTFMSANYSRIDTLLQSARVNK